MRTLTDKWLYFVSSAASLQEVPEKLGTVTEIGDAFGIAEAASLTPEEDHALELKLRWIADQKMLLAMKLSAEERAAVAESKAHEAELKAESIRQAALKALMAAGLNQEAAEASLRGS